jgi:IS605 OrfB family transposase
MKEPRSDHRRRNSSKSRTRPLRESKDSLGRQGEAPALANPDRRSTRVASSVAGTDPVTERAIEAIQKKAESLGVELAGRLWIKPKNKSYEVHAGRPLLGRLTHDELVRCEVERLFVLHRALWLEVDRPPEHMTWNEWSAPLFAAQWALGRLMDCAVDELRLASRRDDSTAPQTIVFGALGGDGPKSRPYNRYVSVVREEANGHANRLKGVAKQRWEQRAQFAISGSTRSCAAAVVITAYTRWQRGEIGYPSWSGPGGSIPLRASDLSLRKQGDKIELRFNACGTAKHCLVSARGGSAWAQLRNLVSNEYEHGDAKLVWDDRRRAWRVSVSYSMPRPSVDTSSTSVLAVRRTVSDLLFVMDSTGHTFRHLRSGLDRDDVMLHGWGARVLHCRSRFQREQRKLSSILHTQGSGARGHGKNRFFRVKTRLREREKNAIDTLLRQYASAIRRAAQASRVREVVVEDMSLEWRFTVNDRRGRKLLLKMPWGRVVEFLRVELEEHGIRMRTVAQAHKSDECPACDTAAEIDAHGYMDCSACGLLCDRQVVSAWHMLRSAGADVIGLTETSLARSKHIREARRRNGEQAAE